MESACAPPWDVHISPALLDVQAFKGKDGMAFFCRKRECGCMVCIVSLHIDMRGPESGSNTHTHTYHLFATGGSDGSVLLFSVQRCSTGRSSQNKQQEESGPLAHSCDLFHLFLSFTLIPTVCQAESWLPFIEWPPHSTGLQTSCKWNVVSNCLKWPLAQKSQLMQVYCTVLLYCTVYYILYTIIMQND